MVCCSASVFIHASISGPPVAAHTASVVSGESMGREGPGSTGRLAARALGFTGTPAWIAGDKPFGGAVGYEKLKAALDAAPQEAG